MRGRSVRRQKVESGLEKRLITALITSSEFASQASLHLDPRLIRSSHLRQVAEWCLDYHREYREAPGQQIESIYQSWSEDNDDEGLVDSVHDLLSSLSGEYSENGVNVPYLLDQLGNWITKQKLTKLRDDLSYHLTQGDREAAEDSVLGYHSTQVGQGVGVDPLTDRGVWQRAFQDPAKPVIQFPGLAGKFLDSAMTRDALIAIQGPEKRGKTAFCLEIAYQALRQRRRVAFFEVGDLSEAQFIRRLGMRVSGRPIWRSQCGTIEIPYRMRINNGSDQEDRPVVLKTREKYRPHTISRVACLRAVRKFVRTHGLSKTESYCRVSVHPNSSINVREIEGILEKWEVEDGFIPDVILIDYADILAPEDPKKGEREQVNDTWKALRRLSQEKHVLVIAPTQADAGSYGKETQDMSNFSEDKRKMAHVTGMLGLNQTPREKNLEVMRLNWIVLRESPYRANQCLWIAQCPALGRALCCSML